MAEATRSIMPFSSPRGGTYEIRYGPMNASEVFEVGDLVFINDEGEVEEFTDGTVEATNSEIDSALTMGVAAFGPGASNKNPKTGTTYATGDSIGYWPANQGTIFITKNTYASAGASLDVAVVTDIGESFQIVYATYNTNGVDTGWGVDIDTAGAQGTDVQALILDVLDSKKVPIRISGNAGIYVTFEIVVSA